MLYSLVRVNSRGATGTATSAVGLFRADTKDWLYPDDNASDLAITAFNVSPEVFDISSIPPEFFVTPEMVSNREVAEGDPVLFAGLFVQYMGRTRLEPILRSGAIAMLPDDLIETTLHKLGRVYLAETHAYGGNSGSPVFVDIAKFANGIGFNYKFLGVIAGSIQERNDFRLQVSTTYDGNINVNSGIAIVVPADDVKRLLFSSSLQRVRDEVVASELKSQKHQ